MTTTCVGRVSYFVKATPRSPEDRETVQALGLPTEPQRFAILDAYTASHAQGACEGLSMSMPWVKAAAKACSAAGVLGNNDTFLDMLQMVQSWAPVLRVGKNAQVKLTRGKGKSRRSGTLNRIAVPLSSNYEAWYHKDNPDANWVVQPVVRIDPRKAKTKMTSKGEEMDRAIKAVNSTKAYFVYTYSMSNNKF
jgi:hypothetical protein